VIADRRAGSRRPSRQRSAAGRKQGRDRRAIQMRARPETRPLDLHIKRDTTSASPTDSPTLSASAYHGTRDLPPFFDPIIPGEAPALHPASRLDELLPHQWKPPIRRTADARQVHTFQT